MGKNFPFSLICIFPDAVRRRNGLSNFLERGHKSGSTKFFVAPVSIKNFISEPSFNLLKIYFILNHIFLIVRSIFLCHVKQSLLFKKNIEPTRSEPVTKRTSFIVVVPLTVPKSRTRMLHGTLWLQLSVYIGVHLRMIPISRIKLWEVWF